MRERKIVLLIDAENTSARYAKRIVDYLEKRGDIICARIYGDFINNVSVKGWNSVAIEYEMEQKQQLTTSAGKNSSDIALVIDAMDLLYQKNIDTLCIVTSDGDFTGLVKRIREDGIEVIGIGKADASKRLEKVCDQYLDFEELSEEKPVKNIGKNKTDHKKAEKRSDKKQSKTETNNPKKSAEDKKGEKLAKNMDKKQEKTPQQIKNGRNAMRVGTRKSVWGEESKLLSEDKNTKSQEKKEKRPLKKDGKLNITDKEKLGDVKTTIHEIIQQEEKNGKHAELGGIKSQLQLKYPGFDEREFGYKTIRELINEETKFQVVLEGRHTYVVPEKAVPNTEEERENNKERNVFVKESVGEQESQR
ncbi:MAG: NYN domain-containing protein [Clostridiales bacterium]|nr:NYN domain-containing protein [Clostridiales bacterium]